MPGNSLDLDIRFGGFEAVHFIENGAMSLTVINLGPVGRRCLGVRVIFEGSKSGGNHFVSTCEWSAKDRSGYGPATVAQSRSYLAFTHFA